MCHTWQESGSRNTYFGFGKNGLSCNYCLDEEKKEHK